MKPNWQTRFDKRWLKSFGGGLDANEYAEMHDYFETEMANQAKAHKKKIEEAYSAGMGVGHYALTGSYELRRDNEIYFYVKTLVRCDNIPKEDAHKIAESLLTKSHLLRYDWLSHKLTRVKPLKIK